MQLQNSNKHCGISSYTYGKLGHNWDAKCLDFVFSRESDALIILHCWNARIRKS